MPRKTKKSNLNRRKRKDAKGRFIQSGQSQLEFIPSSIQSEPEFSAVCPSNLATNATPHRKPAKKQPPSSGKKTKSSLLEHRPIKQERKSSSSKSSSDEVQIILKKGLNKIKIGEKTRVNKKQMTSQTKKSTKAASSSSEEETPVKLKKDSSSSEESFSSEQETSVIKKQISPQKSKLKKYSSSSEDSLGDDFSPRKGASNKKVNVLTSPKTDPAIKPIADLLSNLSDSEEMILLQVPKNVKLSEYQSIDFSGKEKLKFDKEKYVIKTTNRIKNGLLVTDKPRSMRFGGHYIIQKYFENIDKVPIVVPTKSNVPMPQNLKTRHPFFGADYKEKINLHESIEQKLKQAIVDVSKSEKTRKKKKRDSEIDLLSAHSINKSRTMDSSADSPAQKKKKKLITKIKEEIEDPDIEQEFQSPPLKTKIKKEL